MSEYTIEVYSRGVDVGIGAITQAQYDYWSSEPFADYLSDALQSSFDYDEHQTPEECKLFEYYNEYTDVVFAGGPDMGDSLMTIKDAEGNIVYEGRIDDLISEHDPEYELGMSDHGDRDYFISVLDPGYYLKWAQGGKGCYFEGSFDSDGDIDFTKLKFNVSETDHGDIVSSIEYAGEVIDNDAGSYDVKWGEYSVHNVE
jgi:hypothetical protein